MLPHADLESSYEKAVWLWVCRTWRDDDADLEAARIHDRLGITSWPHLLVIDPRSGTVLERAGRSVAGLTRALERGAAQIEEATEEERARVTRLAEAMARHAKGEHEGAVTLLRSLAEEEDGVEVYLEAEERLRLWSKAPPLALDERLAHRSPYERVLALEALASAGDEGDTNERRELVTRGLEDADLLVRLRATRWLLDRAPAVVLERAGPLLIEGNDPLRFAILEALARHPHPALAPVLSRLFEGVGTSIPSGNPNVVRSRVAVCLGTSGDASCLDVLAPIAREANTRNSTTRTVVAALGGVAARGDEETRRRVQEILLEAWPAAVSDDDEHRVVLTRLARSLAHAIAKSLYRAADLDGAAPAPTSWSAQARDDYIALLRRKVDP